MLRLIDLPGYAPFDAEGNMHEGAAREELEKRFKLEFSRVCAMLRDYSSTATGAAAALRDWALESGLTGEPVERIKEVFAAATSWSMTQSGPSSPHSECGHPDEVQAVRDDSGALPQCRVVSARPYGTAVGRSCR